MRTILADRAMETGMPDFEVEQMDGFSTLGMRRQALAVARRILTCPKLTAHVFARAVMSILPFAGNLEAWTPRIEAAWRRLTPRARRKARAQMLAFRCATEALDQALPLATGRPQDASDLMFSLAVFTRHRREVASRRLAKAAWGHLQHARNAFERATLCRALARYHLDRKQWGPAMYAAVQMPLEPAFVADKYDAMVAALRGSAEEALARLDTLPDSDHDLSHPGLDASLVARARQRLTRLRKSVVWVNAK